MTWDTVQYTERSGMALLQSAEYKMQFAVGIRCGESQTASYTGP
jgi:hypothetical protein